MHIVKSPHNLYILSCLNDYTYIKSAEVYSGCKRWSVRGIYSFIGGTRMYDVVKQALKGIVIQYDKRYIATVEIGGALYICAPALAVLTNATKIVKSCKVVYTTIGYAAEAVEDASHIPFLPIDLVIFGQSIPANKEGRFSSWSNISDIIGQLPAIGDD